MKLSQRSQSLIESTIKNAIGNFMCGTDKVIVTDIHLLPNCNSAELVIYDDDDNELASSLIEEWLNYNGYDFIKDAERILRTILTRMKDAGEFDKLSILQPYAFVLLDDEKETLSELLLMDDDTLILNDDLLKGLDKELDDFLKSLLNI